MWDEVRVAPYLQGVKNKALPQVEFGDPEGEEYPLDTPENISAADVAVERDRAAGKLSDTKYRQIRERINSRQHKNGIPHGTSRGTKDAADFVNRYDFTPIGNLSKTPQGGLVVDANLSRVGVLKYNMPDGSVRREYRPQEEVFNPDSLRSFDHATVTDDHPGRVDTANWKKVSVGYVAGAPGRKDRFLSGTLHIQDANTIAKIEAGTLRELSCGYECKIDPTPGTTQDGEEYDAIQREIRGNHVALGPKGWGRAGPEARLHLDGGVSEEESADGASDTAVEVVAEPTEDGPYLRAMDETSKAAVAKAEADLAKANQDLVKAREDSASAKSDAERTKTEAATVKAELATVKAENEVLKLQAKRDSDEKSGAASKAKREAEIDETIKVRGDAVKHLGADWKHDGKDIPAIKREVVAKLEPDMKLDGLEGPALDAVYSLALSHAERSDSSRAGVQAAAAGARVDSGIEVDSGMVTKAREAMEKRKQDASKTPSRRDRARGRGDNKPIVG